MSAMQPACPSYGYGQIVAVTTTSGAFTLTAPSKQLIVSNLGTNPLFVRITPKGGAATTADMCVPANNQVTITKDYDTLVGAVISTGGTTSMHVIPAEGFTVS